MNDPLGIRQLSSGTVASLMRESCRFLLYQCADSWWIDKVQFHFYWFSRTGSWSKWQDCWHDYMRLLDRWTGSWFCCHMGETDSRWQGQVYVRVSSFDPTWPHWNGQRVIDHRLASVGTVYVKHSPAGGFPPDDVIAACIGYVPVRATYDKRPNPDSILGYNIVNWRYLHHEIFGSPEHGVPRKPIPGYVYARAHVDYDRIENWEDEPIRQRFMRAVAC